jgi:CheY-like chemotaxis protein
MPAPSDAKRPAVLVVEDEALLLFSISDELKDAGFEVFDAGDADAAIRLLTDHPEIAVLFTDIDMPGSMDGLKLSAFVRDRWPPVKIIVTSGKAVPSSAMLPRGGVFIPKPYSPAGVTSAIHGLLG